MIKKTNQLEINLERYIYKEISHLLKYVLNYKWEYKKQFLLTIQGKRK